jgi:chorismate mutase
VADPSDPLVARLRGAIDGEDRAILVALNRRIELVHELHRHKRSRGYPLSDPGREAAMLDELGAANDGPLSEEGLRDLLTSVLTLTRAEVGRLLAADAATEASPGQ